jgi:ssDNA thymidine ADP-ribosyltransferase, DarT
MAPPNPTPIYRFVHIDNLDTLIRRGALHAPNHVPNDRLPYRFCHDPEVQGARAAVLIPVGPGGTIHDYVPFYFGYLSPMMLKLKTGQVVGYSEGQEPLIYLVSNAQDVANANLRFVFSDGHGLARFTEWFDDLSQLDAVDWNMVYQRYWSDNVNDMDRQRRKQAEFLMHQTCPWSLITEIAVINESMRQRVLLIQNAFATGDRRPVKVEPSWYY